MDIALELNILGFYGRYLLIDAKSLPSFLFSDRESNTLGIVWFDLNAAEARLQFDSLMRNAEGRQPSQGLLLPATLSFARAEMQLLNANIESVQKLGLQMRPLGETVFLIESIPPCVEEGDVQKILEELISELQGLERDKSSGEEKLRSLAACISRRARSRKRPYSLAEAREIVERLVRSKDPTHCPHGKLTLFHIREEEIENYFTAKTK